MKITKLSLIALAAIALATACSKSDGWSVEGTLSDGAGKKIALQGFNNNNWYTIDSLSVADNGKFSYRSATPAPYPEVLRLSLDGRSIYFPVDSVSAIDITASAGDFGRGYKISGTPSAARFMTVDSLIAATAAAKGESAAQTDSLLKRNLTEIVLADNELITAYYIINKRVAGRPLFDPAVPSDLRVIGAVAQSFATNRPDDPRTTYLRDLFIRAKAGANPALVNTTTIEVPETGLGPDIKGYDNNGKEHSLHATAAKGDVVLLSFTSYGLESSPAYNVIMADLYKKYHARGLEIFQVAFDPDETEWRRSASNMPWITIWNSPTDGSTSMVNYNVSVLPLTYVIDRNGDLRERITDPTKLDATVAKYL